MVSSFTIRAFGGRDLQKPIISPRGNLVGITHRAGRSWNRNEDGMLAVMNKKILLAATDGIGGIKGGEVATRTALETIDNEFLRPDFAVSIALQEADHNIREAAREQDLIGMGCTAVVAEIDGHLLDVQSAGDSRAFLIKPDGVIKLLTLDQNYASWLFQTKNRFLSPLSDIDLEAYYEYVRKYEDPNPVYSSLGGEDTRLNRSLPEELSSGDRLLLTTDGLTNSVPFNEFAFLVTSEMTPEKIVEHLFYRAYFYMEELGRVRDNLTILFYEHNLKSPEEKADKEA